MPMYLESLDGTQSYRADLFCKAKLEEGRIYAPEEIGFIDWLRTTSPHKPLQRKLKAVMYGS